MQDALRPLFNPEAIKNVGYYGAVRHQTLVRIDASWSVYSVDLFICKKTDECHVAFEVLLKKEGKRANIAQDVRKVGLRGLQ